MRQIRFIFLTTALALAACQPQPLLPLQYGAPEPQPLQPYYGPTAAYAPAPVVHRRIVRRHYVRRHVHCTCTPTAAAPALPPLPPATTGNPVMPPATSPPPPPR